MLKIQGTAIGSKKLSKSLCLSIPDHEGMLPENSVRCCTYLIFRALIVCGFWSSEKEAQPFEVEITKPDAAKASFRISFLYMSFMYRGAHYEPPQASVVRRNFSCLISHLWGKAVCSDYMPRQGLSFCFTHCHCGLLAACTIIFLY